MLINKSTAQLIQIKSNECSGNPAAVCLLEQDIPDNLKQVKMIFVTTFPTYLTYLINLTLDKTSLKTSSRWACSSFSSSWTYQDDIPDQWDRTCLMTKRNGRWHYWWTKARKNIYGCPSIWRKHTIQSSYPQYLNISTKLTLISGSGSRDEHIRNMLPHSTAWDHQRLSKCC